MIDIHVLGDLEVLLEGHPVDLSGARLPRLLMALLVRRDHPVSTDHLIEAVFDGARTERAEATLRTYLTRLRRRLADEHVTLVRGHGGYTLHVPDEQVDVDRFERLTARGRTLLDRGEPELAAATLQKALETWRGDAYAGVADTWWAGPEARRLEDLRLAAGEHLVDARIHTGHASEMVPLLREMLSRDPFREGLTTRLVLALYAGGRPADALSAIREHRRTLREELGMDPGPEILRLERRILARDDALPGTGEMPRSVRGYRLGERLGSGRHGTVFAARLPDVDREYAVRLYHCEVADDPQVVRSFEVRARAAAAMPTPATVPIHDAWREPGLAALVMRRMHGGTLSDRLADGPLPLPVASAVAERIGSALLAYSERGLVHGAVRAGSVLFDSQGQPFLGDPDLGPGAGDDDAAAYLALVAACLDGGASDDAGWLSGLVARAGDVPLAEIVTAVLNHLQAADPEPVNPYVGLVPFEEVDADRYFGRGALVSELVERTDSRRSRLVLVVGGSGSGKSSAVRAGLLPRLRRTPGAPWLVTTMEPGGDPVMHLGEALRRVATTDIDSDVARVTQDPTWLARAARRVAPAGVRLVLVIDQLEELFSLADHQTQTAFLDAVAGAVTEEDGPLTVVATVRADYFDHPLAHRGLGPLIAGSTVPVPPMTPGELEEAITGPARDRISIDAGVTGELVAAVVDQPAALPALQFTLHELAERGGNRLRLADLRALGGIEGAVGARAEALFTAAPPHQQVMLRRVLERLVVVTPSGGATLQQVPRADLVSAARGRGEEIDALVESWVAARLLTADRRPDTREPTVDLAHEALVRHWPRLRSWVEANRARRQAIATLSGSAREWRGLERDPGSLLRGARLDQALEATRDAVIPPDVEEYLAASTARRAEEEREKSERERQRVRTTRRLRSQRWLLAAALVVAVAVGALAVERGAAADRSAAAAQARARAATAGLLAASNDVAESDWPLSLLLATEAHRVDDSPLTRRGLLTTLTNPRPVGTPLHHDDAGYQAVSVDAPARTVATVNGEGHLDLIDLDTGERRQGPLDAPVFPFAGGIDAAHGMVAAGGLSVDGTGAVVYRAGRDLPVATIHTPRNQESAVAFSPDGHLLAVTSHGLVRILDTRSWHVRHRLRTGNEDPLISLVWSRDGTRVYAGASPRIYAWTLDGVSSSGDGNALPTTSTSVPDSDDPSVFALTSLEGPADLVATTFDGATYLLADDPLRVVEGPLMHDNVTLRAATSKDSDRLAVAAFSEVSIWSIGDTPHGRPLRLTPVTSDAIDVSFLPDGDLLTVGEEGNLTRWDIHPSSPVISSVDGVGAGFPAFSPSGSLLAVAGLGSGVRLVDGTSMEPVTTLEIPDPEHTAITGVAFLPGESTVVVLACPGVEPTAREYCPAELTAYDAVTGRRTAGPVRTAEVASWVRPLATVTRNGRWVVTGHTGGRVELHDPRSLRLVHRLDDLGGSRDAVHVVEVDASGDEPLLTASTGLRTGVWDLSGSSPVLLHVGRIGIPSAFTPGGRLMTSTQGGRISLRDPRTFEPSVQRSGLPKSVVRPTFSADGSLMATSDDASGEVRLWSLPDLEQFGGPVEGPYAAVRPDGNVVVLGGDTVRLLTLDPGAWERAACATAARNLTTQEWARYFGHQPYQRTCPTT